ncbi:MAG: branched-chain amino acid ABC transporter permease [Halobacteria archaeon]|nr:branched-chain amino acid ABC transporter permease [Halobacteria archaeon]
MATIDSPYEAVREKPLTAAAVGVALLFGLDLIRRLVLGGLAYSTVLTYVWEGSVLGLTVGLAGVGLSMTYSILGFANFAHGDYVTTGGFLGWGLTYVVVGYGAHDLGRLILVGPGSEVYGAQIGVTVLNTTFAVFLGILFAGVATAGVSVLIDRFVYKPMRDKDSISLLIASVGVSFALRYLIGFVYSTNNRGTTPIPESWKLGLTEGTVTVTSHQVALVAVSLVLMALVHLVLRYSKLGKAMRATSDNEDLARITGIPTERVVRWTWILGGGLAGAAGYLSVLESGSISYQFGWLLILLIFAAVILGGIGSIYGAMAGGLVIGVSQQLSLVWLPSGDFTLPTAFLIMILLLVLKPEGLFSGRSTA